MTIIRRTNPLGELVSLRQAADRPLPISRTEKAGPRQGQIAPNAGVGRGVGNSGGSQSAGESEAIEHKAPPEQAER